MVTFLTIFHFFICVFLILVVLLQAGKGGGMGLGFGGGSTNTVFGGSGAGNFLTKLTGAAAALFMLNSMTLAYLATSKDSDYLKEYSKKASEQEQKMQLERAKALTPDPTPPIPGAEGTAPAPGAEGTAPAPGAEGT